jgi:CDP-diacylglycerol---serine O-phosphatidyltransferase
MGPEASDDGLDSRSRRTLFRHSRIPVKALLPNLFTLLSLCAGLTAIRMAIEFKYEAALLLIVAAALIDGIDGRLARALKVQSRFGAELDSLADTVNFGVAPALILYVWGFGNLQAFGWVASMVFACCMGLRLARFNAAIDTEKPKWMSNYFTGIPAPAGAMTVLLPLYLNGTGLIRVTDYPVLIAIYTLAIAFMLVSTIPTWSGKLLGERVSRDYVLPIFAGVALVLGLLWSYPYQTASVLAFCYLGLVPFSYQRFRKKLTGDTVVGAPPPDGYGELTRPSSLSVPPGETKH